MLYFNEHFINYSHKNIYIACVPEDRPLAERLQALLYKAAIGREEWSRTYTAPFHVDYECHISCEDMEENHRCMDIAQCVVMVCSEHSGPGESLARELSLATERGVPVFPLAVTEELLSEVALSLEKDPGALTPDDAEETAPSPSSREYLARLVRNRIPDTYKVTGRFGHPTKKILLLDQEGNRRVLPVMIRNVIDVQIVTAGSNGEALSAAAEQRPDLVLFALWGSGIDGLEFLRALKGDGRTRQIPTIVLTRLYDRENIRQCYGMGADVFLFQPVPPALLFRRIDALLRRSETI